MRAVSGSAERSPLRSAPELNARAPAPGEDDAATGAVALEPVPERGELRHHGARHGIAARLVVDGDDDDVRPVWLRAKLHQARSSGMMTTLPCALRSLSRRMASAPRSSGSRCVTSGFSVPFAYHSSSSSTDRRSLSGACQRK